MIKDIKTTSKKSLNSKKKKKSNPAKNKKMIATWKAKAVFSVVSFISSVIIFIIAKNLSNSILFIASIAMGIIGTVLAIAAYNEYLKSKKLKTSYNKSGLKLPESAARKTDNRSHEVTAYTLVHQFKSMQTQAPTTKTQKEMSNQNNLKSIIDRNMLNM